MRKGFTVPLILVLVLVLVLVPLIFWISTNNFNSSSSNDVMGTTDSKLPNKPGFSVTVNSGVGVWDLLQTGCVSLEECTQSVSSGRRLATASGGSGVNNTVNVYIDPNWSSYEYLKLYVRAGWGANTQGFDIESSGELDNVEVVTMSESSTSYSVAILPIKSVIEFVEGPVFSK